MTDIEKEAVRVKKKIQSKFGSLSAFAIAAETDRNVFQKVLMKFYLTRSDGPAKLKELEKLCDDTDVVPSENSLTEEQIEQLKTAINEAGGVNQFTSDHKEFTKDVIYKAIGGKRKNIGPVVRRLLDHFKIQ